MVILILAMILICTIHVSIHQKVFGLVNRKRMTSPSAPQFYGLPSFFLAEELYCCVRNLFHAEVAIDGFSWVEEGSVCLGSMLYAICGLYLVFITLTRFFSEQVSIVSTFATFFGGSAVYYAFGENWMSHNVELFTTSLFVAVSLCLEFRQENNLGNTWSIVRSRLPRSLAKPGVLCSPNLSMDDSLSEIARIESLHIFINGFYFFVSYYRINSIARLENHVRPLVANSTGIWFL